VNGPFHAGELELQRRAGVLDDARDVGRGIRPRIPAGAAAILSRQRLAAASSLDPEGRVWASLLTGPPGFLAVADEQLLRLAGGWAPDDPLIANVSARPELGLLVLDPATRQRVRFNGRALPAPEGLFLLVHQAYGNCTKYIQRRVLDADGGTAVPGPVQQAGSLDVSQQEWIRRSDTFFIASFHPEGGADASHRGGFPGFVRVLARDRLSFDDYPGNAMFNTLGNLLAYSHVGLLFVDFARGDVLQLAGRAAVAADFSVEVEVDSVRFTPQSSRLRWRFVAYSPVLPALKGESNVAEEDRVR
jgi:predicted pyridoxine 5'-phosphate oxidase superfamily flavin-nucleotide-binding protein